MPISNSGHIGAFCAIPGENKMKCQYWNKTGQFILTFEHGYLTVFDDYKTEGNCITIPPETLGFCRIITRDFSMNFMVRALFFVFPRFNG